MWNVDWFKVHYSETVVLLLQVVWLVHMLLEKKNDLSAPKILNDT